jgi:adenine-specific DNA-methyltransferase
MAAGVECNIGEFFNVLNHITWKKSNQCYAAKYGPENFRQFVPMTERIIFAEHHGADNIAKGEAGYIRKCDELRGFVFEPLRAYLAGEMERAGHSLVSVNKAWQAWKGGNGGMSSHWFTTSQWALPTAENYQWLRNLFNSTGVEYLRRDYEDLRRDYEDLRRPFAVTAEDQYTDVWEFQTVPATPGKHVCEKPLPLMRHIIKTSTKPGAVVLDCFAGSGSTGCAAVELGRDFIGIEKDELWAQRARARIAHHAAQGVLELEATNE